MKGDENQEVIATARVGEVLLRFIHSAADATAGMRHHRRPHLKKTSYPAGSDDQPGDETSVPAPKPLRPETQQDVRPAHAPYAFDNRLYINYLLT